MADSDTNADAAATLLLRARQPLVYGLERATVEAQRRAVEIAELIGGVIDPASSASHSAALLAFQRIGDVSATLGEVRERADLVVYWAIDPDVRSPGFRAKYVERDALAAGRRARTSRMATAPVAIAVDVGDTRGPPGVVERLEVDAASELEALWILRTRLRGRRVEPKPANASPQPALDPLAARLRHCRYGIIFYDADPPPERRDPVLSFALGALAVEANRTARVRLIGVRRPGNAMGAETVLTWQTGFPFAVDFSRGYPRYGPGEFTAERLLARGEADAALLVGVDLPIDLSADALAHLARIPTIVVGGPGAWSAPGTRARFTAPPFEALAGSIYRMDGAALRRRGGKDAGRPVRSPPSSSRDTSAPLPTSPRWGEELHSASEPEDAAVLAGLNEAIRRRLSIGNPRDLP